MDLWVYENVNNGSLILKWIDANSDEEAYTVERKLTGEDDSAWKLLKTLPADSDTFKDEEGMTYEETAPNFAKNTQYDYRVHGVKGGNLQGDTITVSSVQRLEVNIRTFVDIDRADKNIFINLENLSVVHSNQYDLEYSFFDSAYLTKRNVISTGGVSNIARISLYNYWDENGDKFSPVSLNTDGSHVSDKDYYFIPNAPRHFSFWVQYVPGSQGTYTLFYTTPKIPPNPAQKVNLSQRDKVNTITWEPSVVDGGWHDPSGVYTPDDDSDDEAIEYNPVAAYVVAYKNPEHNQNDWVSLAVVKPEETLSYETDVINPGDIFRVTAVNNGGISDYVEITTE